MSLMHNAQTETEGIHYSFNWVVDDETSRDALEPTIEDLYKFCLQLDDYTIWMLVGLTPDWVLVGATSQPLEIDSDVTFQGITLDQHNNGVVKLRALRGSTTGLTPTDLLFPDGSQILLAFRESVAFEVTITYRENVAAPYSGMFIRRGLIDVEDTLASIALVGAVDSVYTNQDGTASVTITADTGTGTLKISVTGVALKTLKWKGFLRTTSARADT